MHPSSIENAKKAIAIIKATIPPSPIVLDVGGRTAGRQDRSYKTLFPSASEYWVADIETGSNVTHIMTGEYELPFPDAHVDLIISGQTLEHVRNPFRMVAEMKRVLKAGTHMVLIAPSGGRAHDKIDCWRFMPDAFKAIAAEVGLEVVADWVDPGPCGRMDNQWHDHTAILKK